MQDIKYILKRVRNTNFKDLKNESCKNKSDLYNYLSNLSIEELNNTIIYMLSGRELSRYYGTPLRLHIKEYLEYFKISQVVKSNNKKEKIEYIYSKKYKLNNYIDTTLRYLKRS